MNHGVRGIIERELFCRCGKCEEAVRDILRMEAMLCQGAKASLTKRRKEIQREARRPYFQADYQRRKEARNGY